MGNGKRGRSRRRRKGKRKILMCLIVAVIIGIGALSLRKINVISEKEEQRAQTGIIIETETFPEETGEF